MEFVCCLLCETVTLLLSEDRTDIQEHFILPDELICIKYFSFYVLIYLSILLLSDCIKLEIL
jgi:hypothetical protein